MSSCFMNLKCKETNETHRIFAIDDYFGSHVYGYKLPSGEVVNRDELEIRYYPRED